jgi:hypothetical protein
MTVKRIRASMLAAEPGRAKAFCDSILDMHPVMDRGWIQTHAAGSDPAGQPLGFASESGSGARVLDLSIEADDLDAVLAGSVRPGLRSTTGRPRNPGACGAFSCAIRPGGW